MSKYTRESPFEFEGVKVWRTDPGSVSTDYSGAGPLVDQMTRAHHAFIEAEREGWHEDGDRFRWGKWTAMKNSRGGATIMHDDFPGLSAVTGMVRAKGYYWHERADQVALDFLTWKGTQEPEEPTSLYAVVLDNAGYSWVRNRYSVWVSIDGIGDPCKWGELAKRYSPLTIESGGVKP